MGAAGSCGAPVAASGEKIVGNVACVARRAGSSEAAVFATTLPELLARVARIDGLRR